MARSPVLGEYTVGHCAARSRCRKQSATAVCCCRHGKPWQATAGRPGPTGHFVLAHYAQLRAERDRDAERERLGDLLGIVLPSQPSQALRCSGRSDAQHGSALPACL
jgi:hypothetical protein